MNPRAGARKKEKFAWEDGVLTLEAELGVNDVCFFEIG